MNSLVEKKMNLLKVLFQLFTKLTTGLTYIRVLKKKLQIYCTS